MEYGIATIGRFNSGIAQKCRKNFNLIGKNKMKFSNELTKMSVRLFDIDLLNFGKPEFYRLEKFIDGSNQIIRLQDGDTITKNDYVSYFDWLSYSDYSGNAVNASNVEFLRNKEDGVSVIIEKTHFFGEFVLIKIARLINDKELLFNITSLEDYPIICEDVYNKKELEWQRECFDSGYVYDFKKCLTEKFPDKEDLIDALSNDQLYDLLNIGMSATNQQAINEQGTNYYFPIEETCEAYDFSDLLKPEILLSQDTETA